MITVTKSLLESLKLTEAHVDLESTVRQYLKTLQAKWVAAYEDEPGVSSPAYMLDEFTRITRGYGPWLFERMRTDAATQAQVFGLPKKAQRGSSKIGRCYYNALDFVKRNGTTFGELVFAVFIDPASLEKAAAWIADPARPRPFCFEALDHAVIRTPAGTFLDPTLGRECNGQIAAFQIIPEEVWSKLPYKENDPNHDATALVRWSKNKIQGTFTEQEFVNWYQDAAENMM